MYATDTAREVDEAYVDTGKVKFVYWDMPLSSHGYPAVVGAEASHCAAEQDAYWEMHEEIFNSWRELADLDSADEQVALEAFLEMGEGIVDDQAAYQECLETQKYRVVLATLLRQARDMGIEFTPTFLIRSIDPSGNEHIEPVMGHLAFPEFSEVIDREISRSQGTPIPDTPTPPPTEEGEEGGDG